MKRSSWSRPHPKLYSSAFYSEWMNQRRGWDITQWLSVCLEHTRPWVQTLYLHAHKWDERWDHKGMNIITPFSKERAKSIRYNSLGVSKPLSRLLLAQRRLFSYRIRMTSVSEQSKPCEYNTILPRSSSKQHLILVLWETHPLRCHHLVKQYCQCILKSHRKRLVQTITRTQGPRQLSSTTAPSLPKIKWRVKSSSPFSLVSTFGGQGGG